jgi:hypothetical protein
MPQLLPSTHIRPLVKNAHAETSLAFHATSHNSLDNIAALEALNADSPMVANLSAMLYEAEIHATAAENTYRHKDGVSVHTGAPKQY